MDKHQFAALVKHQYPQYRKESDEWILSKIRSTIASASPAADKVYKLLNTHQISVGILSGWFQKRLTKQQADSMEHMMRAAKAANEADMALKSSMIGVPREHLGEAVLMPMRLQGEKEKLTHQTDEEIRKARTLRDIQLEGGITATTKDVPESKMYRAEIADLRMELVEWQSKPASAARDGQVAFLTKALVDKEARYHERFGRD
jgi:hypothetical protein